MFLQLHQAQLPHYANTAHRAASRRIPNLWGNFEKQKTENQRAVCLPLVAKLRLLFELTAGCIGYNRHGVEIAVDHVPQVTTDV